MVKCKKKDSDDIGYFICFFVFVSLILIVIGTVIYELRFEQVNKSNRIKYIKKLEGPHQLEILDDKSFFAWDKTDKNRPKLKFMWTLEEKSYIDTINKYDLEIRFKEDVKPQVKFILSDNLSYTYFLRNKDNLLYILYYYRKKAVFTCTKSDWKNKKSCDETMP